MFTKYFTCNTKQKTDREASQDNESAREVLGAWKVKVNWNNCLLHCWWICCRYYGYSQKNSFAGSSIASLNQSLHFRLMWNHDILDLRWIGAPQVRESSGEIRRLPAQIWRPDHHTTIYYYFFWSPSQVSFLTVSSISFWSYTFSSIACYFRSSSEHFIHIGLSTPKIISLYLTMVSLMAFTSSWFLFIKFRRGIFDSFADSVVSFVLFLVSSYIVHYFFL